MHDLKRTPPAFGGDVVAPMHPALLASASTALVANTARFCRVFVPSDGRVRFMYAGLSAAAGNVKGAVYRVGATNTLAYESASVASGVGYIPLGDAAVTVAAGDELLFGIVSDSTPTICRAPAMLSTTLATLPGGFWPNTTAEPKMASSFALGAYDFPDTIDEASLSAAATLPCLFARITR